MSLARSPVTIRISSVVVNVAVVDAAATSGASKAVPLAPLLAAQHRLRFRQTAQRAVVPALRTLRLKAEKVAEALPVAQAARMDLVETVVDADVVVAAAPAPMAAVTAVEADSLHPAELQAALSKSAASTE